MKRVIGLVLLCLFVSVASAQNPTPKPEFSPEDQQAIEAVLKGCFAATAEVKASRSLIESLTNENKLLAAQLVEKQKHITILEQVVSAQTEQVAALQSALEKGRQIEATLSAAIRMQEERIAALEKRSGTRGKVIAGAAFVAFVAGLLAR